LHVIKKAYVAAATPAAELDLLCLAHVAIEMRNGKSVSQEFACRFEIVGADGEAPRLRSYALWAVSASCSCMCMCMCLCLCLEPFHILVFDRGRRCCGKLADRCNRTQRH
jgi:hypothetical protein